MPQVGEERPVPEEDLTSDDRTALGWAVSTDHPVGAALVERVRSGGGRVTPAELSAILRDWEQVGRPAPEPHVHRSPVVLADGTTVTAVTFVADDPYSREEQPSFGLYLDQEWNPPWPHAYVDWPDFDVPTDMDAMRAALVDLLHRARRGDQVELGCLGGHGRTGTALACLATLTGVSASGAVAWVRSSYCHKAVETDGQEAFVRAFSN